MSHLSGYVRPAEFYHITKCLNSLGNEAEGLQDMEEARKEKVTEEHKVIDEAIRDRGDDYTVFSIVSSSSCFLNMLLARLGSRSWQLDSLGGRPPFWVAQSLLAWSRPWSRLLRGSTSHVLLYQSRVC